MATIRFDRERRPTRPLLTAGAGFCAAIIAVAIGFEGEPALSATSIPMRPDQDNDGLSDLQEHVLRTQPLLADTDADGYSDFEEVARNSDPHDVHAYPQGDLIGVGTSAAQYGDQIRMVSAIYIDQSRIGSTSFQIGLVVNGRTYLFQPRDIQNYRAFERTAHDPAARLVGIEIQFPVSLVQRRGRLNLFSIVRDLTGSVGPIVSVMPLVEFSGIVTRVEQATLGLNNINGGQGVVYRPLASDNQIPATWNGGEMCFQRTAAVGMDGVNIVHEIEAAGCVPMDTYCSPFDCAASVGQSLLLPDPAALAGG